MGRYCSLELRRVFRMKCWMVVVVVGGMVFGGCVMGAGEQM